MESSTLRIRLFGALDLRYGETSLPPLDSARAESLLAYLLLNQDAPQPRQRLAFLLWPDSTEPQARTNLRHLLHRLRHALPDPDRFLDATPRTLQWRPGASCWLDVVAFREALARAGQATDGGAAALREAVALYTGDLLDGCYDEWLLTERERLRAAYLDALARLTALLEASGDYDEAVRYADLLLRHDPLREETYRLLMRLHAARGDRAKALHVYHLCVATLERELAVEPSDATRERYEALLAVPDARAAPAPGAGSLGGLPLIGRRAEWSRLTSVWREVERGRAQFVLLTGEPGIGKTRLVEEFRTWCIHRGAAVAEARAYRAEGALAFGPVIAWLRADAVKSRLPRLDHIHLTELARFLPELLREVPGLPRPAPLPEREQRHRLFEAVARAFAALGLPVLIVADDLHWFDRESLQVLHYLLRADPAARLLVAATARRDEIDGNHPLGELLAGLHALDRCTVIDLERLDRAETALLAERIAGRPIPGAALDRLLRETEGSPLFIVEAMRAGWPGRDPGRGWVTPKVQAAIEARLAQLSEPARDLLGVAATIGRAFTTDILAGANDAGPGLLVPALDELWRRQIIREHGTGTYDFSHDKIREVTYLGLSPARRRHLHARVARTLERRHPADLAAVSGEIAVHYERAGLAREAIDWYEHAAVTAQGLYANADAVRFLGRALDLLAGLPPGRERQARELALLMGMVTSAGWLDGWASDRLAAIQQRALDLTQALAVEPEPLLIRSLAITNLSRRDFAAARDFGDRLLARAERDGDAMLLVEADYVRGIAAFWQGEFAAARAHFAGAVERYRPEHRRAHLLRFGLDPKVICQSRLANTLWFLGFPDTAQRAAEDALSLAGEIGHPYSRSTALVFAAVLALDMGEYARTRDVAMRLLTASADDQTRPTSMSTEAFRSFLQVLDGAHDEGIARLRQVLAEATSADQAPGMRATLIRTLLVACDIAGDARTGLAVADDALRNPDGARLWEAEIRRQRASFLAAQGGAPAEIESEFAQALVVAGRQGATMLQVRAAASLLRYRLAGRDEDAIRSARHLLAGFLAALPEGRDSRDVREASALLD